MDSGLGGLRALVTGGSKGIGRRCAELLPAEGAHVSICARTVMDVEATLEAMRRSGVTVHGAVVNVADKAALQAWVAQAAAELGGIDIVIANVSALAVADDEAAWQSGFETDMMHSVRLVNAAMPWLQSSGAASITLVSSVSGREVDFTGPAYGAMKAALVHYASHLAFKLAAERACARMRCRRGTHTSTAAFGRTSSPAIRTSSPTHWP